MRRTEVMPPEERYVCLNTTLSTMNSTWTTLKKSGTGNGSGGDNNRSRYTLGMLDPIFDVANPGIQNNSCSLQDICGMSGFAYTDMPDQSFRFFTPLFVHTGVLHYLINALLHWFVAMELERVMNPIRFAGNENMVLLAFTLLFIILLNIHLVLFYFSCLYTIWYVWKCFWREFCFSDES